MTPPHETWMSQCTYNNRTIHGNDSTTVVTCFLYVLRNCNVSTVRPIFSLHWLYFSDVYVRLDLGYVWTTVRFIRLSVLLPVALRNLL